MDLKAIRRGKFLWILFVGLVGQVSLWGQELVVERLGAGINSYQLDEIAPLVSYDGNTLYFTKVGDPDFNKTLMMEGSNVYETDREDYEFYLKNVYSTLARQTVFNPTQSTFNQDVWIAKGRDFNFTELVHPGPPLNNALPNSICAVTPKPNEFIIINQFPDEGGMQAGFSIIRRYAEDSWSPPIPLEIDNFYTNGSGVSLTMSQDGEVLVLSLQRNDSQGQNDLYVSFKLGQYHYSEPVNLGWEVNSQFEEYTPSLSEDKLTLYFASTRRGWGGSDIYFVKRLDESWKSWSVPRRFKAPINSTSDDSQPHFNPASGYLYFTSKREGSSDIYRVRILEPKPKVANGLVVKGRVINTLSQKPEGAKILTGKKDNEGFQNMFVTRDGQFYFTLPEGQSYKIEAQKVGFLSRTVIISPDHINEDGMIELDLFMDPIAKNATISLDPIYFERSTATISENSYQAIDRLAQILKANPSLQIQIEGHTDNNGESSGLLKLSLERATAVKDFLIRQGIPDARLLAKGFGGDQPVVPNTDEESRKQNRRVEARIVKVQ